MIPATAIGAASLRLRSLEPRSTRAGLAVDVPGGLHARAWIAGEGERRAIPDGNRSAILDGLRVPSGDREWLLGVKGVGAGAPLYGATPIDDVFEHDFSASAPGTEAVLAPRAITGESWMGESPYGAQGQDGATQALEVTALSDASGSIEGARICPVVAVHELPESAVRRDLFWYRRHRGPIVQELRLLPSDVRLFHSSDRALGRDPEAVLDRLGVRGVVELDAFIDRFLGSGIAALTLWARTARACPGGLEGLDYVDAWLDKDCLVGTDGALFVADLESVDWTPTTHRADATARVRGQIDRNQYELLYGLDALLDVRDRWVDRRSSAEARRASVGERLDLALGADRWVRTVRGEDRIDLEVRVASSDEKVRAPFLDSRRVSG